MKASTVLAAVVAAFAASCAAHPALRGQDSDPRDPGALLSRGDRPTPALPAPAAPSLRRQDLEQDGEATAPRGGGRRGAEKAPGAPALQADRPLAALPELAAPSLGVQVLEQDGEATAPRGGGRHGSEEAPGAPDGQRQVALLARAPEAPDQSPRVRELQRVCGGDVLSSSYEFCGFCVDSNGQFYEGILFYDVPDHEDCFAHCPVSDKFVGYDYLPSNPSGLHCICRYEDGTVREYCPEGICRNEDGTVTGNSCPNGSDDSNCRTSISWFGEGPVVRGNDDSNVACRAKLFTTGAALGAALAAQSLEADEFREWVTDTVPELPKESIKNPSALIRYATSWRTNYAEMFLAERNVPDVSFWDVSKGLSFAMMFADTYRAGFDQNIGAWDVSSGTEFHMMFWNSPAFNQNIGAWDVSNGENFDRMFENTSVDGDGSTVPSAFNQDIGSWHVESGTSFPRMFKNSNSFDQDLSGWRITVDDFDDVMEMFQGSGMSDWRRCPCVEIRSWSHMIGNGRGIRCCPGKVILHAQMDQVFC